MAPQKEIEIVSICLILSAIVNTIQMINIDPQSLLSGIVPGTKWCGLGNQAENFHDLGPQVNVDRCCRAHDHCPTQMKALSTKNGVVNFSLFTRSHCKCDKLFFQCLKSTKSPLADAIGNLYFNILQLGCIELHYKTNVDCKKNNLTKKCASRRSNSKFKVKFSRNRLWY